ncbi:50S ribosomal protein L21 [Poriferisphaera corsica]|uniref:Large ribosomal subunit protein bL21 n=1 Tax=Poriferisphaera corsica TaxID=2528020 RepID=A0A517YXB8_9BACT|nr:50S ribosomal protein L21 [Poriferisphaera corsica]QDU34860.1 50S ribosomal protein L21 [Poriferisphaera corsica]
MYAIIEDSGTQIKVSEGTVIKIDKRELADDASSVTFDKVIFVGGEGEAKIGAPLLEGASVEADILEEGRDDKINIVKFKRRKGYHRNNGHRQSYIKVRVTKISA